MALKAVVASLDGLEEPIQALYKPATDGRYFLDVEGVDDMPAVSGLKAKNSELLGKLAQAKEQLGAFGDMTPDTVAELREAAQKAGGERVQELEQKLAQASAAAQREIQAAKEEAEAEASAARAYFRKSEAVRAISAQRGAPSLVAHVVESRTKVVKGEDGQFGLVVLGSDGQPRIKDSGGNPFTVDDLVSELKVHDEFYRAFDPRKGGDTPPGATAGTNGARTISGKDPVEFGRNIEGIAKGEVVVQ